jgi:hypothetical protein
VSATDDRELERYLRRDDALSRVYAELKSERPSPALDQAVLARARDALQGAPRAQESRRRNWPALAALAATVLLSFGLVMKVALEPEAQLQPAAPSAQDSLSLPEASAPAVGASEEAKSSAPYASPAPRPIPAPSSIESQRPRIEDEIRATAEQAPPVTEPALPSASPDAGYTPPPPAATAPAERRSEAALQAQPMREDRAVGAATSTRESDRARKAESAADTAATGISEVTTNSAEPARELAKESFRKTPEDWLAEIARLRLAGEHEAAELELERFRKAHPGYGDKLHPVDPVPERQ